MTYQSATGAKTNFAQYSPVVYQPNNPHVDPNSTHNDPSDDSAVEIDTRELYSDSESDSMIDEE